MDEASIQELLSGTRRGVAASLLRSGLTVASWGYGTAIGIRNFAYDRKLFPIIQVPAPVISLGNLTTGGTGKTPLAAWLAQWLVARGRRPGLLSRGYRSLESQAPGDAKAGHDTAGNDEKRVLDRLCPLVPHLQQRDRIGAARRLINESACDVLILDDGFQHRRLHRSLDLVLIDATQPWGFGHLLPRGLLRESPSNLRRADLTAITRADQVSDIERKQLKSVLLRQTGHETCVEVAFAPRRLIGVDGSVRDLTSVSGCRAFAFCGIGNPGGFRKTLARIGLACDVRSFPDHHHYQPAELRELSNAAHGCSADVALTTLKDLVKISESDWSGPPLYAVETGVEFLSGEECLIERLQRLIASAPQSD